jgi:hypothetical protein
MKARDRHKYELSKREGLKFYDEFFSAGFIDCQIETVCNENIGRCQTETVCHTVTQTQKVK